MQPAAVFLCHGESSAGTLQPIDGVGEVCRANGALFLLDTVCTLGGIPLFADKQQVDVIYSGGQKILSAPPGASPFMMNERAMEKMRNRNGKVATYNLDMGLIAEYWGQTGTPRSYHHTGSVSNMYALREALDITCEEGLENLYARHHAMYEMLWEGLDKLNLKPFVANEVDRLPTVNTIAVPEGVDWAKVCGNAMDKFQLEIAGGLGPSAGKVWRIGLMGFNAHPKNVQAVLTAFEDGLKQQKYL